MALDTNDTPNRVIVDKRDQNKIVVQEQITKIEISQGGPQGIQGPAGATGATGATGAAGATQVIAYTHLQNAVSLSWVITHNLGFYPNIVVLDSAGTVVEADFSYASVNQLTVTLSHAISGYAYLS
jgi:hypothetical protein